MGHTFSSCLVRVESKSAILKIRVATSCHYWLGHTFSLYLDRVVSNSPLHCLVRVTYSVTIVIKSN